MHSEAEALEHTKKRDTGHQSVSLENKTGDSTVLKIGDSAKVVIKQDMKGRKHKYGFNNNKREKTEKKRVVDDETGDKHELTCPKTQQTLVHTALTPNYVLKSLIALWCESNGIELPKKQGNCRTKKCGGSSLSDCDRTAIGALLDKLTSNDIEQQRAAVGKKDAATALIKLLCEGTPTGKKDVATAIFNLSIYQGNKARAVKAGIVAPLIQFLKDAGGGMVDEALAIMAILASHHEGRVAIGQAKPIHILVEVIRTGSPCNRENAAAVLWSLCTGDPLQLKLAKEHGAEAALQEFEISAERNNPRLSARKNLEEG
ncbi:hypothetical protein JHK85_012654 [Glycine max]|nr:hypothetical protein JHK85_012654 [Glycine max]